MPWCWEGRQCHWTALSLSPASDWLDTGPLEAVGGNAAAGGLVATGGLTEVGDLAKLFCIGRCSSYGQPASQPHISVCEWRYLGSFFTDQPLKFTVHRVH